MPGARRKNARGCANVRETNKQPDRTEETKKSKGSVMTAQVHPVQTETEPRLGKNTEAVERKPGANNQINLWDEHTGVGATINRGPRKDRKDSYPPATGPGDSRTTAE